MSKLFTTILPSVMAGALLFGSALSGAQPGAPVPPMPPRAPVAGSPALPPKPPKAPKAPKAHIKIDLGDLDEFVDKQIDHALEAIGDNDQIPPHVRESLKKRLEKVRVKVKQRIGKVSPQDLDALGEELGKMGDEIGAEMEEFGKDMDKWGKDMDKWGKDFEKSMEKQLKGKQFKFKGPHDVQVQVFSDDDDDVPGVDLDDMDDMDDLNDAVRDLGKLNLAPGQRDTLKKLRVDSDAAVKRAKDALENASEVLRQKLENGNASDSEISKAIDDVTRLEADIRKARILAWVKARRVLDDGQRQKVEAAARGKSR